MISDTADPETDAPRTPESIELRHPIAATLAAVAVAGILLVTWRQWTRPQGQHAAAPPAAAAAPAPGAADVGPSAPADVGPSTPADVGPSTSADVGPSPRADVGPSPRADVGPSFSSAKSEPATTAPTAAAQSPVSPPAPAPTLPLVAPATTSKVDAANSLVVTSDPAGARVTVDGIGWGTTPVTIRWLTPGTKTLRVIKDGYASEERSVRITDGRSISVRVPMRTAAK